MACVWCGDMLRNRWTLVLLLLAVIGGALLAQSDRVIERFLPQAQAENALAQYIIGAQYKKLGDKENARLWLRKSADRGNQAAAGFLANFLGGSRLLPDLRCHKRSEEHLPQGRVCAELAVHSRAAELLPGLRKPLN